MLAISSLGKPPKIQLNGLTIRYEPVMAVDIMTTWSEYQYVSSPNERQNTTVSTVSEL